MQTKVIFEIADAHHAKGIERLYRQLVNDSNINVDHHHLATLKSDPFQLLFVGLMGTEVIATAFVVICRDVMYGDQPFAVIENLVVDSSHRNTGVGRNLLEFIKTLCKERRCTKIMLLSSAQRKEAHSFFEACGYRGDVKKGFVNYINRS